MESGAAITNRVSLRGSRSVLIGPLHPSDRDRFVSGMERASADSLYKRFMTPMPRLTSSQLAYLLAVDHRDHEALLAVDEDSGEAVAVGRFVRYPETPDLAEVALLVIDDWQGYGLGKALLRLLAQRARELGIERFEATVLADNRPMLALLDSLGAPRTVSDDGATTMVEVELPEIGVGEHMTGVLRAVGEDGGYELEALDTEAPPTD